jgi:hypothetical protein
MNIIALLLIIGIIKYLSKNSRQVLDTLSMIALLLLVLHASGMINLAFMYDCFGGIKISEIIAKFE